MSTLAKKKRSPKNRFQFIGKILEKVEQQCADNESKHEVDIDEVHMPIAYIAESWTEASDRQEMLFRYFKVVQRLVEHQDFATLFARVSETFCELCVKSVKQPQFNSQFLASWQDCLQKVPHRRRYSSFLLMDLNTSENYGLKQLFTGQTSLSIQLKVLDILFGYFEPDSTTDELAKLIDRLEPTIAISEFFSSTDLSSLAEKLLLLYQFNRHLDSPSIYSEVIDKVTFGEKTVSFQNDDGFIHFSEAVRTIELWIPHHGNWFKVTMSAANVKKIQIHTSETHYIDKAVFMLNSVPQFETHESHEEVNLPEFESKTIVVEFLVGPRLGFIESLEMFHAEIETIVQPTSDASADDSDSDCEIVSVEEIDVDMDAPIEEGDQARSSSPIQIQIESPTKEKSDDELKELYKNMLKTSPRSNRFLPTPKETVDVIDATKSTNVTAQSNSQISTSSFYSKRPKGEPKPAQEETKVAKNEAKAAKNEAKAAKNEAKAAKNELKPVKNEPKQKGVKKPAPLLPVKKSSRTAALKATENLKQNVNDIYNFSPPAVVPKPKRGRKPSPISVGVLIETTNKPPLRKGPPENRRRALSYENDDLEIVEEPIKKSKVETVVKDNDIELTPKTFRKSLIHSRSDANQQIFNNMKKINESVGATFNPNVSFSYRQSATKTKAKRTFEPDTTTLEDEWQNITTSTPTDDKTDANGNRQEAACKHKHLNISLITKSATAIATLANEIKTAISNTSSHNCKHNESSE